MGAGGRFSKSGDKKHTGRLYKNAHRHRHPIKREGVYKKKMSIIVAGVGHSRQWTFEEIYVWAGHNAGTKERPKCLHVAERRGTIQIPGCAPDESRAKRRIPGVRERRCESDSPSRDPGDATRWPGVKGKLERNVCLRPDSNGASVHSRARATWRSVEFLGSIFNIIHGVRGGRPFRMSNSRNIEGINTRTLVQLENVCVCVLLLEKELVNIFMRNYVQRIQMCKFNAFPFYANLIVFL